ncbi:MAG: hypothetical protein C0432_02900 [Candidatus Puniceispirillum sp.]|nr:hypothetical protein [Candidatus Pelagibacter sp.]MBA4283224.1 hypothetical protein [Candidatus Puniceispirillum sp.]
MTVLQKNKRYSKDSIFEIYALLIKNKVPLFLFLWLLSVLLVLSWGQVYFQKQSADLQKQIEEKEIVFKKLEQKQKITERYKNDQKANTNDVIEFFKTNFFKTYSIDALNKKIKFFQKKYKINKITMKVISQEEKVNQLKMMKHHVLLSFKKKSLQSCLLFLKDIENRIPGIIQIKNYKIRKIEGSKNNKKILLYHVKVSFDWLVLKD